MKIGTVRINNFRSIKNATICIEDNIVFVGDNNSGKSTILEAIDLVMGPERLSRYPAINEHDFFAGEYNNPDNEIAIYIEILLYDLSDEEQRRFKNYLEWWDKKTRTIVVGPPASQTDGENVIPSLRVSFKGWYDSEEDDFLTRTYFASTMSYESGPELFGKADKRVCGFLYLRTLRTGNRALTMEKGSLLDIIFQLKELRPNMWENILSELKKLSVATDPELGISGVLASIQESLSSLVSYETADQPRIGVSNMTREHLRKVLTVFLDSGFLDSRGNKYATPYYNQGTGTKNILVLSLLTMIAELKKNVIFAMEEPEIALPPHIQKRVVLTVLSKSTQALFTSHSPYVLEEFDPNNILVVSLNGGELSANPAGMPPTIKRKMYRDEFRKRFCESLLSRRVLIAEGTTEYDVYSSVSRRLQTEYPAEQLSFDVLGISIINAETDSQVAQLGQYYTKLNKVVFAIYDKQTQENGDKIRAAIHYGYEAKEKGIENVVIKNVPTDLLVGYGCKLVEENQWPDHLKESKPHEGMNSEEIQSTLFKYFKWSKAEKTLADFLNYCPKKHLPEFMVSTIMDISKKATSLNRDNIEEMIHGN